VGELVNELLATGASILISPMMDEGKPVAYAFTVKYSGTYIQIAASSLDDGIAFAHEWVNGIDKLASGDRQTLSEAQLYTMETVGRG